MTVSVGSCDPSGRYSIEYFDVEQDDWATESVSSGSQITLMVKDATRVIVQSIVTGGDDQAWQLNTDLISGRGVRCGFMIEKGTCGISISRATMGGSTVVNTFSNLTGSIADKTASDFTVED